MIGSRTVAAIVLVLDWQQNGVKIVSASDLPGHGKLGCRAAISALGSVSPTTAGRPVTIVADAAVTLSAR